MVRIIKTVSESSPFGELTASEKAGLIIDLGNLEVTPKRRAELVKEVRAAGKNGLFNIKNFGMSDEVLERIRTHAAQYFAMSHEEKTKYEHKNSFGIQRGYIWKKIDSDDKTAVIKSYREMFRTQAFPLSMQEDNLWPTMMPELKETMAEYSKGAKKAALFIMGLFSEALGLPSDYIEKACGEPHSLCVLCNYPSQPVKEGKTPIHALDAHSDYNVFTFLQQDTTEGVQFWVDRQWVTIPILENGNSLIVDIGELMEVLSNGEFIAGVHRVVSTANRARLSIASAFEVPIDQTISPAAELINEKNPALYKTIHYRKRLEGYGNSLATLDKTTTTKKAIFLDPAAIDRTQNLYVQDGKMFINGHEVQPYMRNES